MAFATVILVQPLFLVCVVPVLAQTRLFKLGLNRYVFCMATNIVSVPFVNITLNPFKVMLTSLIKSFLTHLHVSYKYCMFCFPALTPTKDLHNCLKLLFLFTKPYMSK